MILMTSSPLQLKGRCSLVCLMNSHSLMDRTENLQLMTSQNAADEGRTYERLSHNGPQPCSRHRQRRQHNFHRSTVPKGIVTTTNNKNTLDDDSDHENEARRGLESHDLCMVMVFDGGWFIVIVTQSVLSVGDGRRVQVCSREPCYKVHVHRRYYL